MSYNDEYYDDRTDDQQFEDESNVGAPSQLLSPNPAQSQTRYSASLSASSMIGSRYNDRDDDSVASIDVNRVGFTPRSSVALTDTDAASEEHPYGYASDPYARADDSMDERDVEAMLLSERSMQYDDDDHHRYDDEGRQYDEYSESNGDDDFGYNPSHQPHDWPHEILTVEDVRSRRTKPLSTIAERSSVGSRSQASQQFSPKLSSEDIPPVPRIPSIFRQQTGEDMLRSISAQQQDPSPPGSLRSHHSRASTDPGAAPPHQARSSSPVKSISTTSSLRDRIALFEGRGASPAPGLTQGVRPGSPSGTHGLGLGLGLSSTGGLGLSLVRSPASMLSTPFSPAQSMPPMSPIAPSGISHHSSMSSLSRDRPASPVKSITSYQSSEAPSANIPSYASSPLVYQTTPASTHQRTFDDQTLSPEPHHPQESLGQQPQPGYVQRVLASFRPTEETGPGLFDVRRRQSLRRASAGATERGGGSDQGHQRSSFEQQQQRSAGGSGSGGARSAPSHKSTPSQGSRPRSEGGSGDGSVAAERSDMPLGTNAEEVSLLFFLILFGFLMLGS
ncbi:hypothetical protein M408DRAFT_234167 [Serendipita vermifera MAFF 305830]|uniref:Uncharacterized protein n=1 Tax=Serendipita vermifera MAFF 305830 TaxID=933852 RepID=A0A0C3AWD0_SERVB|nr:hypothetical protein M408DRAFT_234167 [Serendipita vermifera MAFF 305830]